MSAQYRQMGGKKHDAISGNMRLITGLKSSLRAFGRLFNVLTGGRFNPARSPLVRLIAETARQVKRDDVTLMSAGVAYYAVLSIFPLTLALLSLLRFFTDTETSRRNLAHFFSVYLPDSVGFVDQISGRSPGISSLVGIAGFIGLVWSGTAMISALTKAINRAFGIHRDLPFWKDRPLSILLGLAVLTAFALSLFGSAAIESVSQFNVPVIGRQAWVQVFAHLLPFSLTVTTFLLIYKLLPRVKTRWSDVVPAALFGAVLFEAAKVLFVVYLNRFASFEIYGGMALVVVLMVWSYFSAFVVLVGAEVVSAKRTLRQRQ